MYLTGPQGDINETVSSLGLHTGSTSFTHLVTPYTKIRIKNWVKIQGWYKRKEDWKTKNEFFLGDFIMYTHPCMLTPVFLNSRLFVVGDGETRDGGGVGWGV